MKIERGLLLVIKIKKKNIFLFLEVFNEASIAPPVSCTNISFPQTQYQIYFKRKDNEKVKNLKSVLRVTHIENGILDKETE